MKIGLIGSRFFGAEMFELLRERATRSMSLRQTPRTA